MDRGARYFIAISLVAMTLFIVVALVSAHATDWPFLGGRGLQDVDNLAGPLGSLLAYHSYTLLGRLFAWLLPLALLAFGVGLAGEQTRSALKLVLKLTVIAVLTTSFFALIPVTRGSETLTGEVGGGVAKVVSSVLGEIGGAIILITLLLLVLLTEVRYFGRIVLGAGHLVGDYRPPLGRLAAALGGAFVSIKEALSRARANAAERAAQTRARRREERLRAEALALEAETPATPPAIQPPDEAPWSVDEALGPPTPQPISKPKTKPVSAAPFAADPDKRVPLEKAKLPSIDMLTTSDVETRGFSSDKLKTWSEVLEDKLGNYGVEGRVTAVNQGPLVTTFEFEPAPGVKIKDIVSRSDDLALAMRARSLRLIAPIPGRAVVGIEIPNPEGEMVFLRDVLEEIPERLRYSGIMIALGVDAIGKPFTMNLCSAPHLLMAGTTGSGKSVSLNSILASILFQYRPTDVKMILVDPKMVELSMYNGVPHLLHPVIIDPREAVHVFNYLIAEMVRRNELFRETGVKNIESFNSKVALGKISSEEEVEKLPYIVLVVDELGDLVLTKGVDIESLLSRLSNMARAVGIHMIVATQRPSVDVIVGKTKANFPTRIAFRVATKVDSRTILDLVGAEKLLGRGDMLYVDAKHPEALRLHGCWIGEDELERLVDHWKQYDFETSELELRTVATGGVESDDRDTFFEDAKDVILTYRQGSTSLLQRKLHVGYARAARLLDQLELAGVVGPPDGSKPREVLIRRGEETAARLDDKSL